MKKDIEAKRKNVFVRVYRFYLDGFRSMTLGKTLWLIIGIKLFIMFFVLKLFFFPNYLSSKADTPEEKADFVSKEVINRR
ncbi:MAG: DUF4492 domain-containing protein [Porphyromonas sp.]|nr:DUF4492 domain-containing protein [Porphyromonas sp.]